MNALKLPAMRISKHTGFTLVEMAIVLFIVALLMGGLLPVISSQIEQRRVSDTLKQLDDVQQALLGFAVANGRLPCPASSTSNGQESFCTNATGNCTGVTTTVQTHGNCSNVYNGFVPAATLGLATTGSNGYADDVWGNHLHYAVTPASSKAFTSSISMAALSSSADELYVCTTSTGLNSTTSPYCASGAGLTSTPGVPVVIYSTGKNGGYGGTGNDEKLNPNPNTPVAADKVFISHTPTAAAAGNGEFDDIVIWISPNTLLNRMIAGGKLP